MRLHFLQKELRVQEHGHLRAGLHRPRRPPGPGLDRVDVQGKGWNERNGGAPDRGDQGPDQSGQRHVRLAAASGGAADDGEVRTQGAGQEVLQVGRGGVRVRVDRRLLLLIENFKLVQ